MYKDNKRAVLPAQPDPGESPTYGRSPFSLAAKAVRQQPLPASFAGVHRLRSREHTISMAREIALEDA